MKLIVLKIIQSTFQVKIHTSVFISALTHYKQAFFIFLKRQELFETKIKKWVLGKISQTS